MTTATHSGHCQACGRLQKMPAGLMSLHGYKVTHGFFSGTCAGSRALPFEQSCALIEKFIASAQSHLASIEAFQQALRQPATEPKAWTANYEGASYGRNTHRWIEVDIIVTARDKYQDYTYVANGTNGKTNVTHKMTDYAYGRDGVLAFATKCNGAYATYLEKEARSLRAYIAWQTERVATWQPAPLLPVAHKDKQGFDPEKA